tara:strand:+ start:35 stop:427 length:393 start_codon:yes stop_codon:yes gene_type:complete
MKIKGWIQKELFNYDSCIMIIRYGKICETRFPNQSALYHMSYSSQVSTNFEFGKHYKKGNGPYNTNYYIKYFGSSKYPVLIHFKFNFLQVLAVKWHLKKYLIQDLDVKKSILTGFIGVLLGYFLRYIMNY